MKLYHGTLASRAIKIIKDGFLYPSLSDETIEYSEHNKECLTGYDHLLNGIYFTNEESCAEEYSGAHGYQEWFVEDNKYTNLNNDHCVVFEFEFSDDEIKNMKFGEKTLNFLGIDPYTKKHNGIIQNSLSIMEKYYEWEDLCNEDPKLAEEFRNDNTPKTIDIYKLNEIISDFYVRRSTPSIDFLYEGKLPISKIKSIKIYYDYGEFIESDFDNLENDIRMIEQMVHPKINWSETINY